MQILKRNRATGAIVAVQSATAAKIAAMPGQKFTGKAPPPTIADSKSRKLSPTRNMPGGLGLMIRLHNLSIDTSLPEKERNAAAYRLGVKARDLGAGDPDVTACLERARKHQKSGVVAKSERGENVESNVWTMWSTHFLGGFSAKKVQHSDSAPKPYRLTVEIPGEVDADGAQIKRIQTFQHYGDAERAAIRWWVVKTETGEHACLVPNPALDKNDILSPSVVMQEMTVVIDTLDLKSDPPEVIEGLTTPIDRVTAASKAEAQRVRDDKGATMFTKKIGGGSLGFGCKVKNYVATFSKG